MSSSSSLAVRNPVVVSIQHAAEALDHALRNEYCVKAGEWKSVWWGERAIRWILSPIFKVNSTVEKCVIVSFNVLYITDASFLDPVGKASDELVKARSEFQAKFNAFRDGGGALPIEIMDTVSAIQKLPVATRLAPDFHGDDRQDLLECQKSAKNNFDQVRRLQDTLARFPVDKSAAPFSLRAPSRSSPTHDRESKNSAAHAHSGTPGDQKEEVERLTTELAARSQALIVEQGRVGDLQAYLKTAKVAEQAFRQQAEVSEGKFRAEQKVVAELKQSEEESKGKLERQERELDGLHVALLAKEKERAKILADGEEQIKFLEGKMLERSVNATATTEELEALRSLLAKATKELEQLRAEAKANAARLKQLETEKGDLQRQNQAFSDERTGLEAEVKRLKAVEQQNRMLTGQLETAQKEKNANKEHISSLEAEINALKKQLEETLAAITAKSAELAALQSLGETTQKKLEHLKKTDAENVRLLEKLQVEKGALESRNKELSDENSRLRKKLADSQAKIAEHLETIQKLEGASARQRREMERAVDVICDQMDKFQKDASQKIKELEERLIKSGAIDECVDELKAGAGHRFSQLKQTYKALQLSFEEVCKSRVIEIGKLNEIQKKYDRSEKDNKEKDAEIKRLSEEKDQLRDQFEFAMKAAEEYAEKLSKEIVELRKGYSSGSKRISVVLDRRNSPAGSNRVSKGFTVDRNRARVSSRTLRKVPGASRYSLSPDSIRAGRAAAKAEDTGTPKAPTPRAGAPKASTPRARAPKAPTPRAGAPKASTPKAGAGAAFLPPKVPSLRISTSGSGSSTPTSQPSTPIPGSSSSSRRVSFFPSAPSGGGAGAGPGAVSAVSSSSSSRPPSPPAAVEPIA